MLSLAGQIATIRNFPTDLKVAVAGLSAEQLAAQPLPGEWSVAQIVHHCADSHINSFVRLKLILTEDNPPLKPYDEKAWAQLADVRTDNFDDSFSLITGLHARWVRVFESLSDEQWERMGVHGDLGHVSARDLLNIYDQHCRDHLDQIARTIAAL
jgi:hypothetical protein